MPGPPVFTSIAPATGLSLGDTFCIITGSNFNPASVLNSTTKVFFGGVEAKEVGIISATQIQCLTPGGDPDGAPVAVLLRNVYTAPPSTADAATTGTFTYKRPDISTPSDLTNLDIVTRIKRRLVEELRRTVLKNTHDDMHSEYADVTSALVPQEAQASVPSLRVMGPTISRDPDHSIASRRTQGSLPGNRNVFRRSKCVRLRFEALGVGTTKGEALNLWKATQRYLESTEFLRVTYNAEDFDFELEPEWETEGQFSTKATERSLYQFTLAFWIRGVNVMADEVIGRDHTLDNDPGITFVPGV